MAVQKRGTNRNHIIRAALEAIAYQTADVMNTMIEDSGIKITSLKVDGGASRNNFLMQFQSDLIRKEVIRPIITETTALGAAYLAGLAVGFWSSRDEISKLWYKEKSFIPQEDEEIMKKYYSKWKKAVSRSMAWED